MDGREVGCVFFEDAQQTFHMALGLHLYELTLNPLTMARAVLHVPRPRPLSHFSASSTSLIFSTRFISSSSALRATASAFTFLMFHS